MIRSMELREEDRQVGVKVLSFDLDELCIIAEAFEYMADESANDELPAIHPYRITLESVQSKIKQAIKDISP